MKRDGAVFIGRYIFFVPRRDPGSFHTRVLRYDTRGEFEKPSGMFTRGFDGGMFDGRCVYFMPY